MDYFKPKDLLKSEGDKVQVQIVSAEPVQSGNYGNYIPTHVLVDGQQYTWNIQEDHQKRIKEAGCDATFWIIAYKNAKGFIGFNYVPLGDVSASVGKEVVLTQSTPVESFSSPGQDDVQERIIRGMCFNAAYTIITGSNEKSEEESVIADMVLAQALLLHDECANWLRTGEEGCEDTRTFGEHYRQDVKGDGPTPKVDKTPDPETPPPPSEDFKGDHSLPF